MKKSYEIVNEVNGNKVPNNGKSVKITNGDDVAYITFIYRDKGVSIHRMDIGNGFKLNSYIRELNQTKIFNKILANVFSVNGCVCAAGNNIIPNKHLGV